MKKLEKKLSNEELEINLKNLNIKSTLHLHLRTMQKTLKAIKNSDKLKCLQ